MKRLITVFQFRRAAEGIDIDVRLLRSSGQRNNQVWDFPWQLRQGLFINYLGPIIDGGQNQAVYKGYNKISFKYLIQ